MAAFLRFLPLILAGAAVNLLVVAGALRSCVLPERTPAPAEDLEQYGRMIVIGVDGVDLRMLQAYIDAGAMPHAAALATSGSLNLLQPELPPESPVSWSSLLTGRGPGGHGVFDFVRLGDDYEPINGMVDIQRARLAFGKLPLRAPRIRSRLRAPTFIERVHEAGFRVLSLRQPLLFPAPSMPGSRLMSGLGTPDVAGTAGSYAIYSNTPGFARGLTVFGGRRFPLFEAEREGAYASELEGPVDPTIGTGSGGALQRARIPLAFHVEPGGTQVTIRVDGQGATLAAGERSDLLPVRFEVGTIPSRTIRGLVRFQVLSLDPLTVLTSPVNFDPRDQPFPITSPRSYGNVLWSRYGAHETVGWQEETFPLNDLFQTDAAFLDDLLQDLERGAGMFLGEWGRGEHLAFAVFTATDRACHAFYRYRDTGHPLYPDRVKALGDPIRTVFEAFDNILGRVRARLGERDTLLVVSDHGFQTWRWQVKLNQWLVNHGYLAISEEAPSKTLHGFFHGGGGPQGVDWSKTRAFAVGLGQIYLNVEGRHPHGIVPPGEAEALAEEIATKLEALENPYIGGDGDSGVGRSPVTRVTRLRSCYRGRFLHESPDLQVNFAKGYRVSWQTALLGDMAAAGDVFELNRVPWSGDHCSTDPELVPGILLSNRKIPPAPEGRPYHVRDVAATVLAHFGIAAPDLEGDCRPIPLLPEPSDAPDD